MKENLFYLWRLFCQSFTIFAAILLVWQIFWQAPTYSYSDTLSRVLPSVVGIYGRGSSTPQNSTGAGVAVDAQHILTNYHLVANMAVIAVDINNELYSASIVGVDPEIDIAVLRVDNHNLQAIRFASNPTLKQGDIVFAVGNPYGLSQSASMGIVSAIGRKNLGINRLEDFIQTDAAINPGSSGGPLTNIKGELVGINSALFTHNPKFDGFPQGIGFAVPGSIVRRSLNDFLPPYDPPPHPLGAEVRPMSERLRREILNFTPENKPVMLISKIWKDTPAEAIGLSPGDIILKVNNQTPHTLSETGVLPVALKSITVLRAGERLKLHIPAP